MLVILAIFLLRLQRKHENDFQELIANHEDAQTKTMMLDQNTVRGELNKIKGYFYYMCIGGID